MSQVTVNIQWGNLGRIGLLPLCLFVVLLPQPTVAQNLQTLTVRWGLVKGASGYAVEWKPEGSTISQDRRVTKGEIELSVEPGRYQMRVAALNKFGKPAAWSDWKPLDVKRQAEPTVVTLAPSADEKPADKPQDKGPEEPGRSRSEFFAMTAFGWVPGVPQMYGGAYVRGSIYVGAIGVVAGYGASERAKALAIRSEPVNDNQMITLAAFYGYPLANPTPALNLVYILASKRASNRGAYDKHRNSVNAAAVAGGLLYMAHLSDWMGMRKAMETAFDASVTWDLRFESDEATTRRWKGQPSLSVGVRFVL